MLLAIYVLAISKTIKVSDFMRYTIINTMVPNSPLFYVLKTSENLFCFLIFLGCRGSDALGANGLSWYIFYCEIQLGAITVP